jgi:hypothetical protein
MNEKLQASLVEVIQFLLLWAKETKDFAMEQAPLVVREAIAYGRAVETWELAGVLILTALFLWGTRWMQRHDWYNLDELGEDPPVAHFGTVVGAVALFICYINQVPDFLKVWFAPRLYLLEWAAQLLKTVSR